MERVEEETSLPPGYVSLAQLQERWMKKQQEKKLNEEREEERRKREAERRNREDERRNGGGRSVRDAVGRRNGGGVGVIDEKGKGKEIVIGGIENGEEKMKKKRKKRKNKCVGKYRIEIKELAGGNGSEGVEIVDGGSKGIKEIASVCMVEGLPRNGVKGEIPDVKMNGKNRGRRNESKQSEGRLGFGKKMENGRGYGRKRREKGGGNGEYEERHYRAKESSNGVSEGNDMGLESEKKAEDEILEGFNEKCGLDGGDRNGKRERNNINGEGLSYDMVSREKKVSDEVLVVESAKNDKKRAVGRGYNRHWNWSRNGGEGRRYRGFRSSNYRPKMEQTEGRKIWVEKEKIRGNVAVEVGHSGIWADYESLSSAPIKLLD